LALPALSIAFRCVTSFASKSLYACSCAVIQIPFVLIAVQCGQLVSFAILHRAKRLNNIMKRESGTLFD
jgi:hypothetical protein